MAVLVTPLADLRTQLNEAAPNRDKSSDGWIGDEAHQDRTSSHNPDDTSGSKPEWDGDSDKIAEVRAVDFDTDLRAEFTMRDFVKLLVTQCRAGLHPYIRYIIFDGVIYHKHRNNYEAREYTGNDQHTGHCHVNSEFDQASDTAHADYHLEDLVALSAADKEWIKDQFDAAVSAGAQAVIVAMRNAKLALSDTNMNELEAVITKSILVDKVPVTPFPFVADRMGS